LAEKLQGQVQTSESHVKELKGEIEGLEKDLATRNDCEAKV